LEALLADLLAEPPEVILLQSSRNCCCWRLSSLPKPFAKFSMHFPAKSKVVSLAFVKNAQLSPRGTTPTPFNENKANFFAPCW